MTMACLECLPAEIYLQIFVLVPDLVSLDSLLRASPVAYRVFDNHAVEITDAVLDSGYTFGHTRVLFRIIALIRSGTLPISSLWDFRHRVLKPSMVYRWRVRGCIGGLTPEKLDQNTTPAVIKSILATARHINCLALDCLAVLLARFRALQPEHLADPTAITYQPWVRCAENGFSPLWESRPNAVRFQVTDLGHPSWGEEQRVLRAFWRLQLIYDLKRAATRGQLQWSQTDLTDLEQVAAISPPDWRQFDDVKIRLYEIPFGPSSLYDASMHRIIGEEGSSVHPEIEEILSVLDYIGDAYGARFARTLAEGKQNYSVLNGPREIQRLWPLPGPCKGKEWKPIVYPSIGVNYNFRGLSIFAIPEKSAISSKRRVLSFDPYRRVGFAFWSNERMMSHGLHMAPKEYSPGHVGFAWLSILSPEEITRVKREVEGKSH
ncbi:hypothetical protein QQS21_000332 [Conoideocrella luteorostrata]|uniref:F-box domain-containing protein n=1 Tax=Conoideocrella luteorostrata TaxID=1105319 RepID=A0AAJ0CZY3_9HYPO|nr:hypothetical protein QQS21_000332 [Conoideocrella luteorostrata]